MTSAQRPGRGDGDEGVRRKGRCHPECGGLNASCPAVCSRFLNLVSFLASALTLMLLACAVARGVPPEHMLREWHEADGLPAEDLGSVVLDDAGYLWAGSSSGLARFDGTAFEVGKLPPAVHARGMVYGKDEDGRGRLVAVPADSVRSARDAEGNGFYVWENGGFRFVAEPLLDGKNVRTAFREADGSLWLGCEDGTLLRRRGRESTVFALPSRTGGKRPAFATDADRVLWVAMGGYVARFDGTAWQPVALPSRENEIQLGSSARGGVWLFTRTEVKRWEGANGAEGGAFVSVTKLPELLGAHFIQSSLEDRLGTLWIGTRSQGLFRLQGDGFVRVPTSNDEVTALCEDRRGNLWVATNGGGLNRLRLKAHRLYDQASGLVDNFSYTVAEGADGEVWLGNRDGGVARILAGKVDSISRRAGWRPFSAMSVYPKIGGGWWITTGIGVFETDAGRPEALRRPPGLANTKLVRVTHVARNGDLWLAIDPDRVGLWRDGSLSLFGPQEGFEGREIRAIAEDAAGDIWVAASEGKLFRGRAGRFELVPLVDAAARYGALQSLYFEDDGTLLVGTTRAGLLIFPAGEMAAPKQLNTKQGLPNNNLSGVLRDDSGRYWFASREGIFWIHRSQLEAFAAGKADQVHAVPLGRDDGVPDLSCLGLFQPSVWKARDGTLWFATRRGVLNTDPALVPEGDDLAPVTVAEVRLDGRRLATASQLTVGAGVRKMEVRFSVLNLTAPDRTFVRYRLEGFDDDWVSAKDRVAVYPRLPPGRYVLHAAASDGTGVWEEQTALLTFRVVPAWWQSGWARALYVLAGFAAVTISVRVWLLRRWRRRVKQLEQEQAVERERTRIAQDIHDDIGASLTRISLLSQSAQHGRPPEPRVLEEIYETTHTITRSMDEIVWAINPKFDDLESLVYYLTTYAQKFLTVAKVRFRLEAPAALPAVPVTSQARHHVFLCCKEALNNVVKHAVGADEVTLTVSVEAGTVQIEIADNGGRLEPVGEAKSRGASSRVLSGHGVGNMTQRMRELGGTCSVEVRSTTGTVIRFSIPLAVPAPQKIRSEPAVV